MRNGFEARDSDGFVYKVTREKRVDDYGHPDFDWGLPWNVRPMRWQESIKLCSKRSAYQQIRHLESERRTAEHHGWANPRERLVRVERAPIALFDDVTFAVLDEIRSKPGLG